MQRRLAVVLAVLAVVAGACGGDGDDSNKVSAKKKTTTTLSVDDATTTTSADGTASVNPATTLKGSSSGTTAKTSPTSQLAAAPAPTVDPNAAPAPAQTGTYDYAQSGQTSQGNVPPNGTLAVSGSGTSQTFRRSIDGSNSADLYYVFRNDGPFITRVVLHQGPATINCAFGSPVPAPPWPPTTGRTFSGHATCGNGFTADFSGSITGQRTDNVGGKVVDVVVISSTLHVMGSNVDINVQDTQYWAPSLRVPTYSREVITGTAFGQPVSGDVTSNLKSTTPR